MPLFEKPKWHGWATPEDVLTMMREMARYLEENGFSILFTTQDNDFKQIVLGKRMINNRSLYHVVGDCE
jgi:hypothetical protein